MTSIIQRGRKWISGAARNRVFKNSTYSGLGFAVPFIVNLAATPFLVKKMGLEAYGLWHIAISSLGMMDILEFGAATAISKYVAEYSSKKNIEGLSAITTVALLFVLVVGIGFTLPLYFFASHFAQWFITEQIGPDQITHIIRVTVFGFLPLLLKNSALAVSKGFQQFGIPTLLGTAHNIVLIVMTLFLVWLGGTVENVVAGTVALMWLAGLLSAGWAFWILRPFAIRLHFSWAYARQMFSFMAFTGLAGLGRQLFSSIDRIVVGAVLGLSQVTYYTVSIGVANKLVSLSSSLTQSLLPAASSWHAKKDMHKLWLYFKRSTLVIAALNLGIGGILLLISGPFMRWWMGEEFAAQALPAFRILIVVYAGIAATAPAAQIANGIKLPWINTVGALASGVGTILLIFLLGPAFGLAGTAWANAASWIKLGVPLFVGSYILNKAGRITPEQV